MVGVQRADLTPDFNDDERTKPPSLLSLWSIQYAALRFKMKIFEKRREEARVKS